MNDELLARAIRAGFYIYDDPVEAYLCSLIGSVYIGRRYDTPFKGVPHPEPSR